MHMLLVFFLMINNHYIPPKGDYRQPVFCLLMFKNDKLYIFSVYMFTRGGEEGGIPSRIFFNSVYRIILTIPCVYRREV